MKILAYKKREQAVKLEQYQNGHKKNDKNQGNQHDSL